MNEECDISGDPTFSSLGLSLAADSLTHGKSELNFLWGRTVQICGLHTHTLLGL